VKEFNKLRGTFYMLAPNLPIDISENPHALLSVEILDGPLREKFERITRVTKNLFDVPMALVSFYDEHCRLFKSLLGTEVIETPHEISFSSYVLNHEDIFNVPETKLDERFRNNPYVVGEPYLRFFAGYPIILDRQKLGTISIADSKPRHFSFEQLTWLRDIAALVETEIQNYTNTTDKGKLVSDLDQARMASMIDPLTSLWNRLGIYNILRYRMDEYIMNHKGFAVAILDIDEFKAINDTYGHEVGDHTLRAIAQSLITGCRDSDAIGRWGGEEFLILINETNPQFALEIAERVRTSIESKHYKMPALVTQKITATLGLTSIKPGTHPSIEELINKADQALYQGKRSGRNQVVCI
jgi:diguanylate cyclase (GGDEF)-like protein